jgi:hypothetical protein
VTELFALPKAGKTSGPDHRIALYSMLSFVKPSSISPLITLVILLLVAKETHDIATSMLATILPPHLSFLLRSDDQIPSEMMTTIAKEMSNSKPVVRRAFCSLVGDTFWALGDLPSEASESFANTVFPAFETSMKTVSANPLNAPAGPLEGYIGVAVLLGPVSRSGKFGKHPMFSKFV